jgi:hypothetical protein
MHFVQVFPALSNVSEVLAPQMYVTLILKARDLLAHASRPTHSRPLIGHWRRPPGRNAVTIANTSVSRFGSRQLRSELRYNNDTKISTTWSIDGLSQDDLRVYDGISTDSGVCDEIHSYA